jgi:hypothetical protein
MQKDVLTFCRASDEQWMAFAPLMRAVIEALLRSMYALPTAAAGEASVAARERYEQLLGAIYPSQAYTVSFGNGRLKAFRTCLLQGLSGAATAPREHAASAAAAAAAVCGAAASLSVPAAPDPAVPSAPPASAAVNKSTGHCSVAA